MKIRIIPFLLGALLPLLILACTSNHKFQPLSKVDKFGPCAELEKRAHPTNRYLMFCQCASDLSVSCIVQYDKESPELQACFDEVFDVCFDSVEKLSKEFNHAWNSCLDENS